MSDRKYRQRGYDDDDGARKRRDRKKPPRQKREGPWGRGLGAPTVTVFRCAVCGARMPPPDAVDAVCAKCNTDLHTCTHCAHFDSSAPLECRKPIPQRIPSKVKRNECELFEPKRAKEFGSESERLDPEEARAAFDALFGKL